MLYCSVSCIVWYWAVLCHMESYCVVHHSMLCEIAGVVLCSIIWYFIVLYSIISYGIKWYRIVLYQVLFSNDTNRSSVRQSFGKINDKIQLISTHWLDVYSKWTAKLSCIVLTDIELPKCTKPSQLCNWMAHNNVMNGLQPQSLLHFWAEVIILKQNIFGPHPFCHSYTQPFSGTFLLPPVVFECACLFVAPRRFFLHKMSSPPPPLFVPVMSAATHGWVHGVLEVNRLAGWLGEGRP